MQLRPDKFTKGLRQLVLLGRALLVALQRRLARPLGGSLDALAVLYGTDKAIGRHGYTPHYTRHLQERRTQIRNVLEIGIGGKPYDDPYSGGSSARMWRDYFPHATIYALDLHEKRMDKEPRIITLQADQSDRASLLAALKGCPTFELIVDDGSHRASHITTTFQTLFPLLADRGIYVIEDTETAYEAGYYEGGPPGTPGTSVALVKGLLDDVNVGPAPVASVHAYPGIFIIEKAPPKS